MLALNLYDLSRILDGEHLEEGEFGSMMVLASDEAEARELAGEESGAEGAEIWRDASTSCTLVGDANPRYIQCSCVLVQFSKVRHRQQGGFAVP
jgi:hypothetical protein